MVDDNRRSVAVMIRCQQGDRIQGLRDCLDIAREYHHHGERFTLAMQISWMAELLKQTHPATALDFAAIAESEAIAPITAFRTQELFEEFTGDDTAAVEAARARAATMSYDTAMEFVVTEMDRVISQMAST